MTTSGPRSSVETGAGLLVLVVRRADERDRWPSLFADLQREMTGGSAATLLEVWTDGLDASEIATIVDGRSTAHEPASIHIVALGRAAGVVRNLLMGCRSEIAGVILVGAVGRLAPGRREGDDLLGLLVEAQRQLMDSISAEPCPARAGNDLSYSRDGFGHVRKTGLPGCSLAVIDEATDDMAIGFLVRPIEGGLFIEEQSLMAELRPGRRDLPACLSRILSPNE